jgi:hypothetical protein
MRHTFAGDNYPLVQCVGKVIRSIQPTMDLYKGPPVERPPKNLMVDPIFFRSEARITRSRFASERMCSKRGVGDIVVCENVGIF